MQQRSSTPPRPAGPTNFPAQGQDGPVLFECAVCPRATETKCGRCKSTLFCSRECQEMIWPTHKMLCNREGVRPQVFTQPPLTQEERDYVIKEFDYTHEKGRIISNISLLKHGPMRPELMEECRECRMGCEDRKALIAFLNDMAPAMLYEFDSTPASEVCERHTLLVMLRASLLKRTMLDKSRPQPSLPLRSFWALAGYEFIFAADYHQNPAKEDSPLSMPIRLAINRLMRHFLIAHTLAEHSKSKSKSKSASHTKAISELVHVTALRIVKIVLADAALYGEVVYELMQTWCIQNGHNMKEYIEKFVEK